MANTEAERRGSRGQLTKVWAAVAVVLVIGFMIWLGASSEPSEMIAIREARDTLPARPTDEPTAVSVEQFSDDVDGYRGQNVRVENASVMSQMGTQAFWIALRGDTPFLVRMSPDLVAAGQQVQGGQRVHVAGIVHERTDSVLAAWEQEGVITSAGQRAEAEFAQTFLEARTITPAQ
jgi:hypothetical protein